MEKRNFLFFHKELIPISTEREQEAPTCDPVARDRVTGARSLWSVTGPIPHYDPLGSQPSHQKLERHKGRPGLARPP